MFNKNGMTKKNQRHAGPHATLAKITIETTQTILQGLICQVLKGNKRVSCPVLFESENIF